MYRLAGTKDLFMERAVSKEISLGVRFIFGMSRNEKTIDDSVLEQIFVQEGVFYSRDMLQQIKRKVECMLEEIEDPDYEYTFDCFGEYLLYIMLRYASQCSDNWESTISEAEKRKITDVIRAETEDCFTEDELGVIVERVTDFTKMISEVEENDLGYDCLYWDRDFLMYEHMNMADIDKYIETYGETLGFIETQTENGESGSLKKEILPKM